MEEKETNEVEKNKDKKRIKPSEMKEFIIGILLLGVGLFMLSMKVRVHSGWYMFRFGNFNIPSGTVVIPLIIGVIGYFMNPKSFLSRLLIVLGSIFIVVTIIMSASITFTSATLFEYILMLVLSAAGLGLILKTVLQIKRKSKN